MDTSLFFVSVAALGGLFGILALLMVFADATIANYGDRSVRINGAKSITVKGGIPLLSGLREAGIFIPSACGGRGSCGLCKVKLDEPDGGGPLATEIPWLSPEEIKENVRLSCQFKVKKNISVLIPESLLSVREFEAEVTGIRDLTYDIKELSLRLIEPKEISFRPGQFVQIRTPVYEKSGEEVYRAYSIASSSSQTDRIELEIRYVPDGICTTWVHRYLKKGERVFLNGPYGEFYLRESSRKIVCVAGGSGMAPIKSILTGMAETGNSRNAVYFFGAKSRRDLFLVEEMMELQKKLKNFRFMPALSSPLPEDGWEGETGLITEVLDRHIGEGEDAEAYLCGSPGMIEACIKVLKSKGIPESLIFFDKF